MKKIKILGEIMTVTVSSNDVLINTLQKAAFEQAIEATLLLTEQANSPTFPVTSSAINVLGVTVMWWTAPARGI